MDETNTTLRDLVQWTSPSITYLLHPLVVAGHRRSVTPYSGVSFVTGAVTGMVGWADEARLVRRQTGLFGHPAYWAWVGALEGVLDVLLTAASLSVEEVVCPPPVGGAAATKKPSPYVHNWQMALLAVSERLVWTFLTRPLRIASNRLHAQLPGPEGKYPLEGLLHVLRLLWAEDGLAVFTRSFGPAAAHEVVSSMAFSVYDAAAPFRSLALQNRIRPWCADWIFKAADLRGALDCITRIWNEEGVPGFYKGFVPELLTDLAPAGVLFLADLAISAIFEPSVLFGV
ncbi:uncharacterized protein ACA1_263960 [Acanthamoeba castellanii str. Neff]|uniref:Carrier superfamily protein n=1 Tax=Acanthamoeba castellanii (strain ATCC 30010 / Neff) TaxID=1257118 RepID=L8H450_ACACF|nr:uncharacterized protein ACA1_263960 [Acanthamoeba castellanii str. Neff]ELR19226.1 hypothetical protein ACA1_263960 [Acanthamoeba castellanii str. Neff]